jgi:hypothetical protein
MVKNGTNQWPVGPDPELRILSRVQTGFCIESETRTNGFQPIDCMIRQNGSDIHIQCMYILGFPNGKKNGTNQGRPTQTRTFTGVR